MIKLFRNIRKKLLKEGKTTNYLKYAVGEIILVVIGILIALQINNWNESRKNTVKKESYLKALIVELKKDQNDIEYFVQELNEEHQIFDTLKARIAKSSYPLDTIYYIARHNFSPYCPTLSVLNNRTFQVLQSTGDLGLFESSIVDELYNLYKLEAQMLQGMDNNWADYRTTITDYTKNYNIDVSFSLMNKGKINDVIWQSIDRNELATKFNAVAIAKQNYIRVCLYVEQLKQPIADMIKILENDSLHYD